MALTAAERVARYRERHPERARDAVRRSSKKHAARIKAYQQARYAGVYARGRKQVDKEKDKPCMDCGGSFPPCAMDFDHVRGEKYKEVGVMWGYSKHRLMVEIAKCDLVCSNCHRIRTYDRKNTIAFSDDKEDE